MLERFGVVWSEVDWVVFMLEGVSVVVDVSCWEVFVDWVVGCDGIVFGWVFGDRDMEMVAMSRSDVAAIMPASSFCWIISCMIFCVISNSFSFIVSNL